MTRRQLADVLCVSVLDIAVDVDNRTGRETVRVPFYKGHADILREYTLRVLGKKSIPVKEWLMAQVINDSLEKLDAVTLRECLADWAKNVPLMTGEEKNLWLSATLDALMFIDLTLQEREEDAERTRECVRIEKFRGASTITIKPADTGAEQPSLFGE